MYAGVDKYGGALAGAGHEQDCAQQQQQPQQQQDLGVTLEEAIETASAEETVVVDVPYAYYEDDDDPSTLVQGKSTVLLSAQLNPESGGLMWIEQDDSSDVYKHVIAMSQMTSMLRDQDRNRAYECGIQKAIQRFIQQHNRKPIVLDIGTGTGLLAMLAAKHGAEHVYACEMFKPMAEIASQVTSNCSNSNNITVFPLRSTDLIVHETDGHLPRKADMLVSELFDSILLGEAVLPTICHAKEHLLVPNAVIVPERATIFAQIEQNPVVFRMNSVANVFVDATSNHKQIRWARNESSWQCTGSNPALPLHVEALQPLSTPLTPGVPVLSFDFTTVTREKVVESKQQPTATPLQALVDGQMQSVVMWWEVSFDHDNTIVYSTKPGAQNWQDHWVQVVFPLAPSRSVVAQEDLVLHAHHDELRVWFSVSKPGEQPALEKQPCICGLHLLCNAERIAMLTDESRNSSFDSAIGEAVALLRNKSDHANNMLSCLDISDGSLGALLAAGHGVQHVTSIESKDVSARIFEQIVAGNGLDHAIDVICCGCKGLLPEHLKGDPCQGVDLLVGEPFYYSMQNLPLWQAFNFWLRRTAVHHLLSEHALVVPAFARVCAVAVTFEHLHECFGAVDNVCGFDHRVFDGVSHAYYTRNFPFPVYMYPFQTCSNEVEIGRLDFTQRASSIRTNISMSSNSSTTTVPNAVIIYVEYALDQQAKYIVATGPAVRHQKQWIRFLKAPPSACTNWQINGKFEFDATDGTIQLDLALA